MIQVTHQSARRKRPGCNFMDREENFACVTSHRQAEQTRDEMLHSLISQNSRSSACNMPKLPLSVNLPDSKLCVMLKKRCFLSKFFCWSFSSATRTYKWRSFLHYQRQIKENIDFSEFLSTKTFSNPIICFRKLNGICFISLLLHVSRCLNYAHGCHFFHRNPHFFKQPSVLINKLNSFMILFIAPEILLRSTLKPSFVYSTNTEIDLQEDPMKETDFKIFSRMTKFTFTGLLPQSKWLPLVFVEATRKPTLGISKSQIKKVSWFF